MKNFVKAGIALGSASILAGGLLVNGASASSSVANVPDGHSKAVAITSKALPRVFAVINSNAAAVRGKGLTSSVKLSTGTYDVRFNRNISTCAWTGTVGLGGFAGSTGAAEITITGRAGTTNGLFVTTFNGTGALTDEPFHVVVICS
ncbi:hypothetical protein ACPPVT_01930 [Angustibacter sp. McL0619]|uniref:hypothetical protein n=1 Tax=Angustibacter sp. McL0619 TaxID=3415676 RepID=UPI003CF3D61A